MQGKPTLEYSRKFNILMLVGKNMLLQQQLLFPSDWKV